MCIFMLMKPALPSFGTMIYPGTVLFLIITCIAACKEAPENVKVFSNKKIERLPGVSDSILTGTRQAGEVLISYSNCYTCHKIDRKSMGPAFTDIARRYPATKAFVSMLSQKIITGGTGVWGNTVMLAHTELSKEDATKMVLYILSLYPGP